MESVSQNGVVRPSVPPRPRSLMKPSVPPRPHSMVRPSVPARPHSMVRPSVPPRPHSMVRPSVPPRPHSMVRPSVPARPHSMVQPSVPPRPHSMVRPSVPPRPHSMVRPSVPPRPHSVVKPSASSRHSSVRAPEWKCSTCALVNEGYCKQCKSCGLLRSTKKPPKSSSSEEMGGVRRRSECAPKETPGIVSIIDSMLGFLQLTVIHVDPNVQADNRGLPSQPQTQDQYIHHRTSTGQRRVQVTPERCEAHQQQHSDEGQWLKESTELNPTVCLKETTCEDALEANTMYQRIQQYCVEHGEPFTDPDFPPTNKSLYIDPKKPISKWNLRVGKWERPLQVRSPFWGGMTKWTVVREPRPDNVAQGELGNCWFLSALGVVAQYPQLIDNIIITKQFSPKIGAYQIRLCKDGHWQVVVVDDYLPRLRSGELVFSKAPKKQLWVPLVEKALAKLYGSYEALEYGMPALGLSVLTGLPCETINLKELPPEYGDHDLTWARLLSFRERNFLMCATCNEKNGRNKGLEVDHVYSILDVRQLGSERLVRLRNPWGRHSWKGSWSDQDPRWHSQPQLRNELQAVGNEPGVFWMGAQDFFQYFTEVSVCRYYPNWYSFRSEGTFHPFAASQIRTLAFQVHSATEVDISIQQPTSRCKDSGQVDMAVLVLRYPSTYQLGRDSCTCLPIACTLEGSSHTLPIATTSGFLAPGSYVILPLAFNHYRHLPGTDERREKERERTSGQEEREDGAIPYVAAVFSAQELVYESIMTGPGFLAESLFLLAEKIGKASKIHPNMAFYEVCLDKQSQILVAVNSDPRLHFTVTVTVYNSVNIFSSRGALCTKDCIPPRHRQVLIVLTPQQGVPSSCQCATSMSYAELNSQGRRGAEHTPELTSTNRELHSPRLICNWT